MFNKKYAYLVLFSLLICMVAISSVSAAEDTAINTVVSEEIAIDSQDDIISNDGDEILNEENQDILASDGAGSDKLSLDDSDDVLASYSPSPDQYSVEFTKDTYTINYYDGGTISLDISPNDESWYYDFYFDVYSGTNNLIHQNIYSSNHDDYENYLSNPYQYMISPKSLSPGTYTMKLVNYKDYSSSPHVFDEATLIIEDKQYQGNIKITASGTYYKAKTITVEVTDDEGNPVPNVKVLLKFSNDKEVTVTTLSNGKATYKVPYNAGSYSVIASPYSEALTANVETLSFSIAKGSGKIIITQAGKYATNKKLTFKVIDTRTGKALSNQRVDLTFSNGKKTFVRTNSKGIAIYLMKTFTPGNYFVKASATNVNIKFPTTTKLSNIKIDKTPVTLNPRPLTAFYASGKYFNIKVTDNAKKAIGGVKLKVDIYTGSSKQTKYLKTISTGWTKFAASTLDVGTHKVVVSVASTNLHTGKAQTSSIIIKKAGVDIYAPNIVNAFKQDGKYGIRINNHASGNPLSGWTVQIKVYTGSSAKIFKVKTNSNGYASIATNTLSKGKHTVVVTTVANNYYNAGKSSGSITISTKIPTRFNIDRSSLRYNTLTTYMNGMPYATYIMSVQVPVHLVDNLGHEIIKTVTLTNDEGTTTGTSGEVISMSGGSDITLRFAGDSKYMPCTFVLTF